jgi:hypothetical protein
VTEFFYEPRRIDYKQAHNLKLPMQSFLSSIGMALTHSYLIGTFAINFLITCLLAVAAVNLAGQAGLSRRATLVAGLTFFSLPLWAHYIGQPMQYTVAVSINFLIALTAVALVRKQAATPVSFGILTALLTLNYDWYVFAFALLLYLIVSGTLRTFRDYAVYFGTAVIPLLLWRLAVQRMTSGAVSTEIEDSFVIPVLSSWLRDLAALRVWPLTPFVVTSVGLRILPSTGWRSRSASARQAVAKYSGQVRRSLALRAAMISGCASMKGAVNIRPSAISTTAPMPSRRARSAIARSGAFAGSGKAAAVSTRTSRRKNTP